MSDKDDPFGLSNDAGRTRIRPQRADRTAPSTAAQPAAPLPSGGHAPQPAYPPQGYGGQGGGHHAPYAEPAPRLRQSRTHPNVLVAAFAPLLELAPELERAAPPARPDVLRVRLQSNLTEARDAAVGMGVPLARADLAAWFVAALLDDIALNTPWGGQSDWPRQPLVTQLSGDVDAGTRFFDRFDEHLRFPNRDPQMLELGYLCLGLGFRGKYRVQPGGGESAIMALRAQAVRLLRGPDADDDELSPRWQGVIAPDEPRRFTVPLWTVGLAAAAIMTAIYMGLGLQLSAKANQLYALAALIPPSERAEIIRPERETAEPVPEIVVEPVVLELLPLFAEKAPPETVAALKGREDASLAILQVQGTNPELFRSAKAELNEGYGPLIASIGQVIAENAEFVGKVTVIGHTDNVPVQRSNPFASNQGLSEARAAAIAEALIAAGVDATIVSAEGHADTEPIADNGTKEGRARNRRVEIKIEKRL
jgi:type VI secretion system protein ImpK